ALTRGHVFPLLKAERPNCADCSNELLVLCCQVRLSAVLDHRYLVGCGDPLNARHVARVPEEMGRDDRPRPRRNTRRDALGRHVETHRIHVGEDRDGLLVEDGGDGTHVGDRRGDDLVTGLGIDRGDGRVDGSGPRCNCTRVGDPIARRKGRLERLYLGALRAVEGARLDHLTKQCELLGTEVPAASVRIRRQHDGIDPCAGERHYAASPFTRTASRSALGAPSLTILLAYRLSPCVAFRVSTKSLDLATIRGMSKTL